MIHYMWGVREREMSSVIPVFVNKWKDVNTKTEIWEGEEGRLVGDVVTLRQSMVMWRKQLDIKVRSSEKSGF